MLREYCVRFPVRGYVDVRVCAANADSAVSLARELAVPEDAEWTGICGAGVADAGDVIEEDEE